MRSRGCPVKKKKKKISSDSEEGQASTVDMNAKQEEDKLQKGVRSGPFNFPGK